MNISIYGHPVRQTQPKMFLYKSVTNTVEHQNFVTDPQINDFAASNLCLALEENKSLKSLNLEVKIESNETKIKSNKTGGKNRTKSNQIKQNWR